MRWVWRVLAVVGALALVGALAYVVYAEVQLHREVRNICSQFSGINCKHFPDRFGNSERSGSLLWNPKSGEFDGTPSPDPLEYNPWTGKFE